MQHVVFNQKGGVGKSTITCNLAAISAWQGQRTLVIDLDSQGNSTRYLLGSDTTEDQPNVAEFFEQSLKFTVRDKPAGDYIVNTRWEGLDLMPSSPLLDELHGKLESRHKIYKLRDALEQVKDVAGAHGIFSMSASDHLGLDDRAYVMVKIENGTWKYQP